MPLHLPAPIAAYFDADRRAGADALAQAFADDAIVKDEGALHTGRAAIRDWWRAAKARYQNRTEPLQVSDREGTVVVQSRVSGNFQGCPTTLEFAFRVSNGNITSLEVR